MADQPAKPIQTYTVSVTRLSPDESHVTYSVENVERGRMAEVAGKVEAQMIQDGLRPMPKPTSGGGKPRPKGVIHYDTQKDKILVEIPFRGKWDNDEAVRKANQREYSDGIIKKLQTATNQTPLNINIESPDGKSKKYYKAYPPNFARMIAQALPTDEFDMSPEFKQLLEAQA